MRDNVTITVNANLEIPDSTAERCMRLLEMWLDDNPDKTILCDVSATKHKMYILKKGEWYKKHEDTNSSADV